MVESLDLRGRRRRQAVLLFSAGRRAPGVALGSRPLPVRDAVAAAVATLAADDEEEG